MAIRSCSNNLTNVCSRSNMLIKTSALIVKLNTTWKDAPHTNQCHIWLEKLLKTIALAPNGTDTKICRKAHQTMSEDQIILICRGLRGGLLRISWWKLIYQYVNVHSLTETTAWIISIHLIPHGSYSDEINGFNSDTWTIWLPVLVPGGS